MSGSPRGGQPLSAIDWSAESSRVLEAIGQVRDEAVREMLTREYDARGVVADSVMSAQEKARILAQKRALAAEVAKSLGPKILDRYVGEYDIEQLGYTLSVSRTQDGLYSRRPGQAPDELLPLSETRFFTVIGADVYDYEFTLDGANQAGGLVITGPGQRFTGKRE